jgi:GntR family transcriptional regulator
MDAQQVDQFLRRLHRPAEPGVPKYAQLRRAIISAIEEGYWRPGAKLPTEVEFARLTPFSLGTVQRGLRALAEEGIIERRQGHGSFIAEPRHEMEDPLHCRFLGEDGVSALPIYPRVLRRSRVAGDGPWTAYLGERAHVFRIDRVIDIGDEFSVFSAFYADIGRLRPLLVKPLGELGAANFKLMIGRELRLPVTEIEHRARVGLFPRRIGSAIGVPDGAVGMILQVAARSGAATYVYYQEIYIPPNRRTLEIRAIPAGQAGASRT